MALDRIDSSSCNPDDRHNSQCHNLRGDAVDAGQQDQIGTLSRELPSPKDPMVTDPGDRDGSKTWNDI